VLDVGCGIGTEKARIADRAGRLGRVHAPSLTTTDATAELEKSEGVMSTFRGRLPMGRPTTRNEVAAVIAFPASDDASFVNGMILPVDGGLAASSGEPNFSRIVRAGPKCPLGSATG
jgi:NAD(P)-dependent dehydrogenase (short-subunit alcohol dehydrogenase family)